jgi:hypothetical protein
MISMRLGIEPGSTYSLMPSYNSANKLSGSGLSAIHCLQDLKSPARIKSIKLRTLDVFTTEIIPESILPEICAYRCNSLMVRRLSGKKCLTTSSTASLAYDTFSASRILIHRLAT